MTRIISKLNPTITHYMSNDIEIDPVKASLTGKVFSFSFINLFIVVII